MPEKELITQAEFSRRVGLRPQSVGALTRNGKLEFVIKDGRKFINWGTQKNNFQKIIRTNGQVMLDPVTEGSAPVAQESGRSKEKIKTIGEARFELEKYKAKKAKEEYLLLAGSSIKISEVKRAWEDLGANIKKAILSLPARIGPLLAGESDPHKTKIFLNKELIKCLQDTVDKFRIPDRNRPNKIPSQKVKLKELIKKRKLKKVGKK